MLRHEVSGDQALEPPARCLAPRKPCSPHRPDGLRRPPSSRRQVQDGEVARPWMRHSTRPIDPAGQFAPVPARPLLGGSEARRHRTRSGRSGTPPSPDRYCNSIRTSTAPGDPIRRAR
jgi:hypothetical protein